LEYIKNNDGSYYGVTFPGDFGFVYDNGGKQAGTYIFMGTIKKNEFFNDEYTYTGSWSKQP